MHVINIKNIEFKYSKLDSGTVLIFESPQNVDSGKTAEAMSVPLNALEEFVDFIRTERTKLSGVNFEPGDVVYYLIEMPGFSLNNLGIVTSVNESYVFVRYGDKTGSEATSRVNLTLIKKGEKSV